MLATFSFFIPLLKAIQTLIATSFQLSATIIAHYLSHSENKWLKNKIITVFLTHFSPDLKEAKLTDPFAYKSFNHFFTRQLGAWQRPLNASPTSFLSPADGTLTQLGYFSNQNKLIQAKSHSYSVSQILGNQTKWSGLFKQGIYSTVYLAPHNYHRVHMPVTGKLTCMIHIPGTLASVSLKNTSKQHDLYVKNERVACIFDTQFGPMAVILIGATLVGSIETVWHGLIRPKSILGKINCIEYNAAKQIILKKGEMLGWFHYGSTVVTVMSSDGNIIPRTESNQQIKYGESIADLT